MLLVIPLIELSENECTCCISGENGTEKLYKNLVSNPEELAKLIRRENAKSLYLKDCDSFKDKNQISYDLITKIVSSTEIPVQLEANFQTIEDIVKCFELGIYRVVLGAIALEKANEIHKLMQSINSSQFAFKLDSFDGVIYFNGHKNILTEEQYVKFIREEIGGNRIVYHYNDWDEANPEYSYTDIIKLAEQFHLRFTLLNAASKPEHLWELNKLVHLGIDSIVLGESLFYNNYPCQKIWRLIEEKLEQ